MASFAGFWISEVSLLESDARGLCPSVIQEDGQGLDCRQHVMP